MVFIVIFRNNICFWQYQLYNVTYSTSTYPIINVYFRSFVFYCLTGSVYPRYTISHWCYYSNPIFLTPIFYPLQAVPEKYRWALQINPLTILIEETRNLFIYGIFPNWSSLGISFLISIVVLYLGFFWFYKTQKGFSDVL